ncbi:MAG: hypothetical protein IJO59_02530 [Clostridia bacterium]|nr:hypothetical protein [Clostridia bacterium]
MKKNTPFAAFWDAFLPNNVVLLQAAGLCPILAVGTTLQNGVALSACTAAVMLPLSLFVTFFGNKLAQWLRPALYALLASVLLLGTAFALHFTVSPELYAALYIFLPLMAVNTLFTYRTTPLHLSMPPLVSLADAFGSALGFALVLCISSALREMAIYGTVWNIPLGYEARFPEAAHPFIGFLLLGFMSAALQWFKKLLARNTAPKGGADL